MSASAKQRNREAMPQTAAIVDEFRRVFGPGVRVLWAREGELEVGKRAEAQRSMSAAEWREYLRTGLGPGGIRVHP